MTQPRRRHIIRRLYDWMLSWAESPHGTWALFWLAFAESSFFPLPPDPLLMALALGRRQRGVWYAVVCSAGSILGGLFGYAIGFFLWEHVREFFYGWVPGFTPEREVWFRNSYHDQGFLIVFLAGFTPIPYKVFTLVSGAVGMNVLEFFAASLVSRSARFLMIGGLIRAFGDPIRRFIDRWFDRLAIGFAILLVAGFAAVKFLL